MIFSNAGRSRWKPPIDGVDAVLAGELPHVAEDVHDARVAAAGEDDEALAAHVRDQRLVVEDQRVGLPAAVAVGLETAGPLLELGRAVDLAGDQQRAVEQERRLPLLDDLEARALERALARRRQLDRRRCRASRPGGGSRSRDGSAPARSARPSRLTIPSMPVVWSQWPWLSTMMSMSRGERSSRRMFSDQPVRREPGVEQDADVADLLDRHEAREAVLGAQRVAGQAAVEEARRHAGSTACASP